MSYEFNPESDRLELPNPYKIENTALFCAGAVLFLAGVGVLLGARSRFAHMDVAAGGVLIIALGILSMGIYLVTAASQQLRFFFGRNRPSSLAPTVHPDSDGDSKQALHFKETLRQNALEFSEPSGALDGVLYSFFPNLIFAPHVIRNAAQTQFYSMIALAATLVSFAVCWLAFGQSEASGWIGIAYGIFTFMQILRPVGAGGDANLGNKPSVGKGGVLLLILMAIVGPVFLGVAASKLPALPNLSINGTVLSTLIFALVSCMVFGLALKNQLKPAPRTIGSARVTETLTMNAHPNKLIEELDRMLMERWVHNIPNRRYTRRSPVVSGAQGQFTAEIFEETQPRPQSDHVAADMGHALSTPRFFWLACLSALGFLFISFGAICAILASRAILAGDFFPTSAAYSLSFFGTGLFCFRAAHLLWGRFDFVSELIWVDILGSFESARVDLGNRISGGVQTSKNVLNIESMTLRVWVSEIDSVIFGKNGWRQVVGMRGLPAFANEVSATLKNFGETRSMVLAPTSMQDLERAKTVGMVSQLITGATPPEGSEALLRGAAAGALLAAKSAHCDGCGSDREDDARFCGECGHAFSSALT